MDEWEPGEDSCVQHGVEHGGEEEGEKSRGMASDMQGKLPLHEHLEKQEQQKDSLFMKRLGDSLKQTEQEAGNYALSMSESTMARLQLAHVVSFQYFDAGHHFLGAEQPHSSVASRCERTVPHHAKLPGGAAPASPPVVVFWELSWERFVQHTVSRGHQTTDTVTQ